MRSFRHIHLALAAAMALTALPLGAVEAQTVVGGDRKPAVEVDLSVLDRLGAEPTLPDQFLNRRPQSRTPAAAATDKIILKRPVKKTATAKPASPAKPVVQARKESAEHTAKAAARPESLLPAKTSETPAQTAAEPASAPVSTPAALIPATTPRTEPEPSDAVKAAETGTGTPATATPRIEAAPVPAQTAAVETTAPAAASPAQTAAPTPQPVPAPAETVPAAATAAVETAKPAPAAPTNISQPPAVPLDGSTTLAFDPNGAVLSAEAQQNLDKLAARLNGDDSLTLLLMAYASSSDDSASRARHLSLSRALAVRSNLIDRGIRSTRIEVRALGNKTPGGNPDRVDLILQKR